MNSQPGPSIPGPSIPWMGYNPKPRNSGNNPYKGDQKKQKMNLSKYEKNHDKIQHDWSWYSSQYYDALGNPKTLPERDLQSQRHYYYYNGQYISVITLPNHLIISSDPIITNFYVENDVLVINRNNIIRKNDSTRNLEAFIICLGLSLLFYKNKINMDTVVNYGDQKLFVHSFSESCIPFNTTKMVFERESDINRLKSFKLKKIMSKKEPVIYLEPLKIDVPDKKTSSVDIIRSNKLQSDILTTHYIVVPKINNGQILYNKFISSSINYINNLSLLDQTTISGYTAFGDVIVSAYIREELNMDIINRIVYTYETYTPNLVRVFPFFSQIIKIMYPNEPITLDLCAYVVDHLVASPPHWIQVIELYIQDLKRILDNAPKLEFNMMVFRGLDTDYIYTHKEKSGYIYLDTAQFKSASIDYTVADNFSYPDFSYYDATKTNCCVLRIFVPKGTPLLYINGVSNVVGEHEVLLNIGTKFLVKGNSIFSSGEFSNMKTTDVVIVN
jgi:hypothetical protein